MQGRYSDQRKWAWMHDGISAKINIQRCPQMIAQREVLVEASADRNTCCDSSHGVIRCMQKSNDMPQPGSPPNENKIRALACFSCASIKVVCGLWFFMSLGGIGGRQSKKATSVWILDGFLERIHSPHRTLLSTWLVSQAKGNIFGSIWSCCAKIQERALVWHRLW